ncbi:SEC-C metal-binding domain-containing protein [Clostridium estertheticum]|uniref:SEC-C metal-binding domain-containing protein n=1 Tax=Clostridium estertheticum TaxID=238834 RepID=UPI001CF48A59|nr:SEC-C metal-binding domain-containing protein [Clostridium estertheticum]MCB2353007.1 SEC-C domain-containing protein [Clostridium estertheticum]WAG40307.1 SEC-C domain-containing protein [Clostridium estertheticum]
MKKEIPKNFIVKSKFYSSRMIIKEIYCTNANCDCREVILKFLKIDGDNNEGKILFSVALNIDTLRVIDKVSYDLSVKADEIIAEFITDFDLLIKDRFNKNDKISKGMEEETSVKTISQKAIDLTLNGSCVAFSEIFEDVEIINFRDGKNNLIYVDDQYCMNPKCLCNETFISFIVVNEVDKTGENVFTLRYSLKNGKYDIESMACADNYMNDILKSFKKEEKQIRRNLNKRYRDMKVIGKRLYNENKMNTVPRISTAQVGRNDVCPCGSGKKYKKCCGR